MKMRSKADVVVVSSGLVLLCCFAFALNANAQTTESSSSQQTPSNRGAARQMYGSGSLRQTGSLPILTGLYTTDQPPEHEDGQQEEEDEYESRNSLVRNRERHGRGEQQQQQQQQQHTGATGARQKPPAAMPADFYDSSPMPDHTSQLDDKRDDDSSNGGDEASPSFRNGASVNGRRANSANARGEFHPPGYSDTDVPESSVDRTRPLWNSATRNGHTAAGANSGPEGRSGLPGGFFEDEANADKQKQEQQHDIKSTSAPCGPICTNDQFLCASTCTCIDIDSRCDDILDCENDDDEINCEGTEMHPFNETCQGKRSLRCPTTGKCIAKEWFCDGENDCGDFSDESHCGPQKNCTTGQFECRNGLCLPQNWVCDGENDCKDFSDEESCSKTKICFDNDFVCLDGTCILDSLRCDGHKDCVDGTDEIKCEVAEVQCKENQFQCAYPRCISLLYRCDGDDDCGDGSDEENCPTIANTSCNTNEFRCTSGSCISKNWLCDKEIDCKDGEDEQNCEYPTANNCTKEEFSCSNGVCIPRSWSCDGVPDCSNGEDEHGCELKCELTQYMCKPIQLVNETKPVVHPAHWLAHAHDNQINCISIKHVCDGVVDCPEKDDEENCPKKVACTKDDKCSHQCILTVDNKKACACDPGYVLGKDNVTCEDIDECKFEKDPVCSQKCTNTKGSFVCECSKGYVLRPDGRSCKALGANPSLLLANRVDIRQVSISGPKYTSVLKGLHNAIALDYHYKRNLIYWSDVSMDVIRKLYVNGTEGEDFVRWGLESPGGLAIDWIHDLLFWTDSGTRRVEVMTLDTKIRHVLVSRDLDKPRAIAVHPHFGYVFWTDWGPNPKIERSSMDGSDRKNLLSQNIHWPNGLTIDYTTDRIYWVDAKHRVIESATIYGLDRKKVVTRGLHHPFAITVFEDAVYWTDWHFKSIFLANKNNGRGYKTIHSGLHFPMDLHSYHPQRQPEYPNHCGENNGKCSHMCLPKPMGYNCVCPVGLKIQSDGKTCAASPDNLLIFARKRDLRLISLDQSVKAFDVVVPVDNIESAVALTWNSDDDSIYWTDVESDTISKAGLDGSNQKIIIHHNLESPAGLALDWITKKLYWTDAGTNRIECSNLDGTMRTLLIYEGLDKPRDIVVDPINGLMYWSDWGKNPKIEVAAMDGSNRRSFITTNLTWPNGLAIDFEKKRLYWADGGTSKIEYSDLDGKHRTTIISEPNTKHPFGLVIHRNKIYWTDWDTKSIHRADKDTGNNVTAVRSDITGLMDVRVFHRNRQIVNNPCGRNNGDCSHLCLLNPTQKRYKCACPTGLILNPDGKTCPDMPSKFLLMSHRIDVRVLSLDTNYTADTVLPMEVMKNVSGADVDLETGFVYWTDPGQPFAKVIKKVNFKGKSEETIIDSCIDTVDSLVVDSVGRKIYWTDVGLNSIEVAELDGRNRKVIVWSGLDNPRAIALHYPAGLVFWTDWGHNARIERADMDGEHRSAVVTEDLTWPNGLSVDLFADRLYWNDAKRNIIESADLMGQNRKVILDGVKHPYGLSVVGDFLYWSDWQEKALLRAKKSDGKNKKVVIANLEGIMDLRLIDKKQVRPENACGINNGGCSHLCLRNPNGFNCACPTGIILNSDNKTCNATPTNFLLLATKKALVRMSLDTPEMWEVPLPVKHVYNAFSVDFHWEKKLIFYTDVDVKVIRRINMSDFSDVKVVTWGSPASSPFRLAVDWIADNIYWTDMKHRMIEVARLDGSSRKKLIDNLKEPRSLALFPKEGYLFWAEWGDHPRIERANLDGSNRRSIISTDLSLPNGLSIDYEARKLYWADALKDRIEVSDLSGRYRIALVPEAVNAFGLSQYGNHLFWGDWFKEMIERADKRTGKDRNQIRTALDGTTEIRAVSASRQTGWTPCAMENGGCTHLCFYTRKNYTCGCPDQPDSNICSIVPRKRMPLRKPGTENDPNYDEIEEEDIPPQQTGSGGRNRDGKLNDYRNGESGMSLRTMITTTVILLIITVGIIIVIIYLQCPRKNKRENFSYGNRRNVLTFSNPNYNASAGTELTTPTNPQAQDKKGFIWKRLKYDKSQERVYEDNGPALSPEVVSLIPPCNATPSSSRAPSVSPLESSPPAMTRVSLQKLEPTIVPTPKPRPIV
ncbi:low-density lipoprotein receptor-related protein 4-like isoform X3 [Trichogramma pretiosum]|uniref:low-density lipoprotein receptor-related protein 4-like isoform X3 n=1 Tax=Trichogramma pretiosum TaxID=7493 RepID=UPI0006C94133|nr:low-density lipoprotein receptor-related protein 4-like isoform X3 [Trichogramma pretiosum]